MVLLSPKHIQKEKRSFIAVLVLSLLSFVALTYQTYTYYVEGYCGCSTNPVFQLYSQIWGIPISLIGMFGVGISIALSIYFLTLKENYPGIDNLYQIFQFWVIFQLVSVLFVVNMMYIAYIKAHAFCELCLVTQIVTFGVFILLIHLLSKFRYYAFVDSQGE